MTPSTRRRLFLCAAVAALTLPAEFVLIKAVTTDSQSSSAEWVQSLSESSLTTVAREIQQYPFTYRKEIMARLSPAMRARVWTDHIVAYRDARPELSSEQVDALNAAIAAAQDSLLGSDGTRAAAQANTQLVAERVKELFGAEVTDYLLYRLGNKTTLMLANAAPWHLKLADYVRAQFVVEAREAYDCSCNLEFGCDLLSLTWCDRGTCTVDDRWPMCGWFWNDPCDGVCKIGGSGI